MTLTLFALLSHCHLQVRLELSNSHTHIAQEVEVIEGVQGLLQQTLAQATEQIRWV